MLLGVPPARRQGHGHARRHAGRRDAVRGGKVRQFLPCHRHRHARPGPGAQRVRRDGGSRNASHQQTRRTTAMIGRSAPLMDPSHEPQVGVRYHPRQDLDEAEDPRARLLARQSDLGRAPGRQRKQQVARWIRGQPLAQQQHGDGERDGHRPQGVEAWTSPRADRTRRGRSSQSTRTTDRQTRRRRQRTGGRTRTGKARRGMCPRPAEARGDEGTRRATRLVTMELRLTARAAVVRQPWLDGRLGERASGERQSGDRGRDRRREGEAEHALARGPPPRAWRRQGETARPSRTRGAARRTGQAPARRLPRRRTSP
jgi:hypothetical protein